MGLVSAAPKSRVLLVDDDAELCALMTELLSGHGFDVMTATDGVGGLDAALATGPDVVVLDVMMPRLDGFDVLRRLRKESRVPVLMLSARTSPADRIQGLNVGADDYLLKPFASGELLARIRALLRRSQPSTARFVDVGTLRLDRASRSAQVNGQVIALTGTEFDVLELLAESPGAVVSRDTIARLLYGRETTAYERAIDVHIHHLRKKLGEESDPGIKTVRGHGYVLARNP